MFVFDLDNVLYDYDPEVRMTGIARATGLSRGELDRRWWNENGQRRADRGAWSTGEAQLSAMRDAGVDLSVEEWIRTRRAATTVRPGTIQAVRGLSNVTRTVVLSNNDALMQEHHAVIVPELSEVIRSSDFHTSAKFEATKPHRLVFTRLCALLETRPGEVVFFDDRLSAVSAAAHLGMRSVHVKGEADVLNTITQITT